MDFFSIFFDIFLPGPSMNGIPDKNFCFSLFQSISSRLAKTNAEKRFFNFLNFLIYFFRNFLARFEYERNLGQNFFFLFLGLFHPVLVINNAGKRFFNFCYFFRNFLPRVEYERNSGQIFFFSLSWPLSTRPHSNRFG